MSDQRDELGGLSERGAARRDEMLRGLQDAVVVEGARRQRRRSATRRAAGVVVVALVGAGVFYGMNVQRGGAPGGSGAMSGGEVVIEDGAGGGVGEGAVERAGEGAPVVEIVRIRTDSTITERLAAGHDVEVELMKIGDRELLFALREMGHPAGLARSEGRVWLTASVEEPEEAPRQGDS
ncbi:MAG: hypothetical protein VYC34_12490 [Planctomycetota bacterium]|nr:hypothetical protein [Planctomycetota bacterium]